ncbi:hypothetical protein Hte_003675 [Hypoxylon texense]
MEETEVIIVGAGPAGLALALSLARFNIHSVILEKDLEITQDPRGVYLTHDAIRILWDLGLGDSLKEIGHEVLTVNFHATSFKNDPFHVMHLSRDDYWQTLPNAILHIQPKLVGRQQDGESVIVQYQDRKEASRKIKGSFLVGADGKKGVVRKHFLEASAGIKQVDSAYRYDGTWVAANLKLTVPTPESHPDFPLWDLGFTPEAVYDLFWPKGWHFCSPPGKPTAAGRFGPYEARFWRHEFAQNDWDDSMDAEKLLWEHITPMVTHSRDSLGRPFPGGEVTYPPDCIHILRCRPYQFTHKVVNKWFDDRTILIGDAAHVFPPFGGQGIASGLRDAHQLAWRIALLQRMPQSDGAFRVNLLKAWARERHEGVKDAATFTRMNGRACNQGDDFFFWLLRNLVRLFNSIPFLPNFPDPIISFETRGYQRVEDGFFLKEYGGGGRLAQVYVESKNQTPVLSDELIKRTGTMMSLLVIVKGNRGNLVAEAQEAVRAINLDKSILSEDSIRVFSPDNSLTTGGGTDAQVYCPTSSHRLTDLGIIVRPGYNGHNYFGRFGAATKFVIVRPDFYTFALANDVEGLVECLGMIRDRLG